MNRRDFLRASTSLAAAWGGLRSLPAGAAAALAPPPEGAPEGFAELAEVALEVARRAGASYADCRVVRSRTQDTRARDRRVESARDEIDQGIGIRVIAGGAWGFAATSRLDRDAVARRARDAVESARASASLRAAPVRLAPAEPVRGAWRTPVGTDPFTVPLDARTEVLLAACAEALRNVRVTRVDAFLSLEREEKWLATSEGTRTFQETVRTHPGLAVTARRGGVVRRRTYQVPPLNIGWEHVLASDLAGQAARIGAEAHEHCLAPPAPSGPTTLVLSPSHLSLTIHETIGHATEADRILGWEADYAGTSFVRPDHVGRLRYGSPHVHVVADRDRPTLRGTCRWDDDGVPTGRWDLVREGVLVGLTTTRETAPLVGEASSRGCCSADSWASFPFLKIPNVSLEEGPEGAPTLEELVADVEEGILVDGPGSYSIDQQRLNFQFGGDAFWRVEKGRISGMVRDVVYHGITPAFWGACDAVTGPGTFEPHGVTRDGKGQPGQRGQMSHGAPWARFRGIEVGGGRA